MTSPQDTFSKLTPKQRLFVEAYLTNNFNAHQAALTAGYSPDSARVIGPENLSKPAIKSVIETYFAENTMGPKEVLLRLTDHARGDIGELWDESTGQVNWDQARALGKTALIKKIRHKTTRITRDDGTDIEIFEDEIELHNPQFALQLLGKQHGLFTDKLKIEISWQDETIQLIKAGQLTYEAALETFDHDDTLVKSLFAKAQVSIST